MNMYISICRSFQEGIKNDTNNWYLEIFAVDVGRIQNKI